MKVFYTETPPKSRTEQPQAGTCFSLSWDNVVKGAQQFRRGWLKGTSAANTQKFEEEIDRVVVSDHDVTFFFKDNYGQDMYS